MKKVSFHTLGCKLNFSETSTIARQFENGGFVRTGSAASADICVINTCSVTEHADKKCRNLIRRIHRANPTALIAVTGCYAQLRPNEIASIQGVDLVLSNRDKGELFEKVVALTGKGAAQIYSCETDELVSFFAAFSSGDRTRAFLKVQDGCDYQCAYCTIHRARGSSRNLPVAKLVAEAETIAGGGQKEIVLTGINVGDFGRTTGERFIDLLRALDNVRGIERYRISSIEPNLLTDEIIAFCAASDKFQPHFHIPIQSGSDRILAAMRRRYTTAAFRRRIDRVREAMPDAFIGIDVIVGFPGESDEDFLATRRFLEEIAPSFLHVFPYSERPGTPSVNMPGKVSPAVAAARAEELGTLCTSLHETFCRRHIGCVDSILVESTTRNGRLAGYTGNYIKVSIPYEKHRINTLCRVRMEGLDPDGSMNGVILDME